MAFVVTFIDYTPPPRLDDQPWTTILVKEGVEKTGPWTLIETIAIVPVDTDPEQPESRSFTTDNAQLEDGWYQVTFQDAAAHAYVFTPVHNTVSPEGDWLPTITDVALLILSRTKDKYGNEVGSFNSATRPTNVQTSEIIVNAAERVADTIGSEIPEVLWEAASDVVAQRAAMDIELAFFPEQVNSDRSPYRQLKEQYEEDLALLARQVQVVEEGGDLTAVSTSPTKKAVGSFPDQTKFPPYGLGTRW